MDSLASDRRTLVIGIAGAWPVALCVWFGLRFGLPPIPGMDDPQARLIFALGCIAIAVLLTLLTGIEAVAHERLASPAIDPLAGAETLRMRINMRYLQNTLEQTILFVVGLAMLAFYAPDGGAMRAVVATSAVWILARWAFWIGYHRSPLMRAPGAVGVAQSIIVLNYGVFRFGASMAGVVGGIAPVALFLGIEAYLFVAMSRPPVRR